jgi:hypothetical protein
MERKTEGRVKKAPSLAALVLVSFVGAWSADIIVDGAPLHFEGAAPAGPAQPPLPDEDAVVELRWDTGTRSYFVCEAYGTGKWFANDFDLRQIPDYSRVTRLLVYSSPSWPNAAWDGFRLGIFAFNGSVPGSLLWGPKFVKAGLTSAGWANFSVAWTLPPAQLRLAAGLEQYYDYPACDPHAVDNNRTFLQHSWFYHGGWGGYRNSTGYYNLMIRVRVSNAYVGLMPSSIGRVKALYY